MIKRLLFSVVLPIVFGYAIGACLTGCGASFEDIEKAAAGGDVSSKLAKCRSEARTAFYVEQKSKEEALARYDACKKREGL